MKNTTNNVLKAAAILFQINSPVILWGLPGIGKSRIIETIGEFYGFNFKTVVGSQLSDSDVAGIPVPNHNTKQVSFYPLDWVVQLNNNEASALFVDEFTTCMPQVQSTLLKLVLDKAAGDYQLRKNLKIIAAANPISMVAGGSAMEAPMANRFCHLHMVADIQMNSLYLLNGGRRKSQQDMFSDLPKVPNDWYKTHLSKVLNLFSGFQKNREQLFSNDAMVKNIQNFNSDNIETYSFLTPRSFENAAEAYAAGVASGTSNDVLYLLLTGFVGKGVAMELFHYIKENDILDPLEVLGDNFKFSSRNDLNWVHYMSTIYYVTKQLKNKYDHSMAMRFLKLATKLINHGSKEIVYINFDQVFNFVLSIPKAPNETKELTQYIINNKDISSELFTDMKKLNEIVKNVK